jgi:hypothetical protein
MLGQVLCQMCNVALHPHGRAFLAHLVGKLMTGKGKPLGHWEG